MQRLYTTIVLLLLFSTAYAQDIIQRTDGVKIEGKVLEVKGADIQFTKKAEDNTRVYIINKADVVSVTYENGTVEQYNISGTSISTYSPATSRPNSQPPVDINQRQHILAIRPLDLLFTNFSLLYEHLSKNHKFGIRLPLSIGFGDGYRQEDVYDSFSMLRNRTFSTGLDLNFYVGRPNRFKYYIGPSTQLGFFKYSYYSYPIDPNFPPIQQTRTGTHYAILLNNGFWYQIGKQGLIGMDIGLGMQRRITRRDQSYYYGSLTTPKFSTNISLGFQF